MERLSDKAIEIINALQTEKLHYESEYLPLIDAANKLAAYEDCGLTPEQGASIAEMLGVMNVPPDKTPTDIVLDFIKNNPGYEVLCMPGLHTDAVRMVVRKGSYSFSHSFDYRCPDGLRGEINVLLLHTLDAAKREIERLERKAKIWTRM